MVLRFPGSLHVAVFLGLCGLLAVGLQKQPLGDIALSARINHGACVAWVNAEGYQVHGVDAWPNWAEPDLFVQTSAISGDGWSTSAVSHVATIATFVTKETAQDWNLSPAQPHVKPGTTFQRFAVKADRSFTVEFGWHDRGDVTFGPNDRLLLSLGLSPRKEWGGLEAAEIDIVGTPESKFELRTDGRRMTGLFGGRLFVYASAPPSYPDEIAARAWGGALLRSGRRQSSNDCVLGEAAPAEEVGLTVSLGPVPLSGSAEPTRLDIVRAVTHVTLSGLTGTMSFEELSGRPFSAEKKIDASSALAQLSIDTAQQKVALAGRLTSLRVDGVDVCTRWIETWPWYMQAFFWSALTWALSGLWQQRTVVATLLGRGWRRKG